MHGGLAMPALGTATALEPQRKGWKVGGKFCGSMEGASKVRLITTSLTPTGPPEKATHEMSKQTSPANQLLLTVMGVCNNQTSPREQETLEGSLVLSPRT